MSISVFTRSHIEGVFPDRPSMLYRQVSKLGASTGFTKGEIIMEDIAYPIRRQQFGTMFAVDVTGYQTEVFAHKGDSGALVTINIERHAGVFQEFALGIVSQKKKVLNKRNAVLCVWLEDCLKALGMVNEEFKNGDLKLYKGCLTVNARVNSRKEAFKCNRIEE